MKDKSLIFKLNILRNQGNFLFNFSQFLLKNDGGGYESFFNILKNTPLGKKLFQENIISSYDELWNVQNHGMPKIELIKHLIWNILQIKDNIEIINCFLNLKKEIERFTLNAEYQKAFECLEVLEEKCGVSFWSLEVRLLLEKLQGIDSKEVINSDSVQIIIDLFKLKIDSREQGVRYQKKMKEIIYRTTSSEELRFYLFYKMGIHFELNDEIAKGLLLYESINSIIDIFLLTQYLFLNNIEGAKSNNYLKKVARDFSELCGDKSWGLVSAKIWGQELIQEKKYSNIFLNFEMGDFDGVIKEFNSNRKVYLSKMHLVYLYIISLMLKGYQYDGICENDSVGEQIIKRVFLYLSDNNEEENNALEIETICRVFDVFCFSKELSYLFNKFFNPMIVNPITIMGDEDIIELVECYESSSSMLLNVYYEDRASYSLECLEDLSRKGEGELSVEAQKYINMLDTYIRYYYYLKQEKHEEALNVLISNFVSRSEIVGGLDITNISDWIESIKYDPNITVQKLIYIDLVDQFKDLRTSAFLNFLDYNHLSTPLEVLEIDDIKQDFKLYYLERLCRIENLAQLYYLFEQSDDVEDYRIKICQKLLELTEGEVRKNIEEEINIIYRQRNKRQKLSELDEGRLSVDFEAVRMSVRKELSELYYLYNNIPENEYEIRQGKELIQKELQELINRLGFEARSIEYISKRSSVIKEMYEVYLKEFCFGKNGLDIYLSTRIRHGAFSNQILKVFSAHNITKDRLLEFEDAANNELLEIYEQIENIINDIIQNKLKVNYESADSSAIFNFYEGGTLFFDALNGTIKKSCVTIDDCSLAFEEIVTDKTNAFLQYIRSDLLLKTKNKFSDVLGELLIKAKELVGPSESIVSLEKDINDCNLELKETIEKISAWFVVSRDRSWPDFSFNALIELCNEIGKSLHLNFEKAKIVSSVDKDYQIRGKYYKDFNDIFMILQNNAFTHSGFKSNTDLLNININVLTNEKGDLEIIFKNNLDTKIIKTKEIDLKIDEINAYYSNATFSDSHLHKEGGTGLFRTINILFSILKIGAGFKVARNKDIFEVHILLKKSEVLNEEIIIN